MKRAIYFMLIMAAHAATLGAASHASTAVSIRTYNYATVAVEQMSEARSEAAHIFKNAGISLEWIECRVPGGGAGAACTEPLLVGRDLMLRLVDRTPSPGARVVALGESMLDREQRGGVLMTIDVFPVRAVGKGTATAVSTLLGRAIAHEIGHLLLGSAEHPRIGLMRAVWSHDELRGLKPAHWGFSSREAAVMRETLWRLTRTAD
jgi:hypothetical protein